MGPLTGAEATAEATSAVPAAMPSTASKASEVEQKPAVSDTGPSETGARGISLKIRYTSEKSPREGAGG